MRINAIKQRNEQKAMEEAAKNLRRAAEVRRKQ